jgi:hypothetical protein
MTTQHTQPAVSLQLYINTPAPRPQQGTLPQTLMYPHAACNVTAGSANTDNTNLCASLEQIHRDPSHSMQHSCLVPTIQATNPQQAGLQPTTVQSTVQSTTQSEMVTTKATAAISAAAMKQALGHNPQAAFGAAACAARLLRLALQTEPLAALPQLPKQCLTGG